MFSRYCSTSGQGASAAVRRSTDRMRNFVYALAAVSVGCEGRVSVARVTGLVTPTSSTQIMGDSAQWGGLQRPLVNVVDYLAATVAVYPDQLFLTAARVLAPFGGIVTPTALVASPDQLPMFTKYASIAMSAGHIKYVFSTVEDALRWAARQQVVRLQWEAAADRLRRLSSQGTSHTPVVASTTAAQSPLAASRTARQAPARPADPASGLRP